MEVHKHKFIKWPRGNAIHQTLQDFKHLRPKAFPGAFMALDGCHIKVPAPWDKRTRMRHVDQRCYINRKHVASVVLQVGHYNKKVENYHLVDSYTFYS